MFKQSSKIGLPAVVCGESLLAIVVLATVWGCGGRGTIDPSAGLDEDQKAVQSLVYTLADSTRDLEQFRSLYAKDKAPASTDMAKYKGYMFYVRGDITISGTTANFTAGIEQQVGEAEPTIVEKPWTAAKEGEVWKLSDTPLP